MISILPFESIFGAFIASKGGNSNLGSINQSVKITRITKIYKLSRFLRLAKLARIFKSRDNRKLKKNFKM